MTREELDRRIRVHLAAQRAIDMAEKAIRTSPVRQAEDHLAWLESRALAGDLGPGRDLADYDVHTVVAEYARTHPPARNHKSITRRN